MTADRAAAAARSCFDETMNHWLSPDDSPLPADEWDSEWQEFTERLASANLEIRERRSEPVVEISVEGATEACDCVRILWESRGQHSPAGMRTEKALQELQSALARATGAAE
jgi:hypothetical protein